MIESRAYDDPGWFQDRGETVFAAFSPDSDAFGSLDKTWKINFRVDDLDGVVVRLRAEGIDVHPHSCLEAEPRRRPARWRRLRERSCRASSRTSDQPVR